MKSLALEVRSAIRRLTRRSSASIVSIALIGLGVGLTAAFFSVLDSALLSGLPFQGGDRLIAFSTREAAGWPMPLEDFRAIEEEQGSFDWVLPFRSFNTMVTHDDVTRGMIGSYVHHELFDRFGVRPVLGRGLQAEDARPDHTAVALISHRLWQDLFGGSQDVLGTQVVLNREPTIVIGVMPPGFQFPIRQDVWGVMRPRGREWSDGFVFGVGRLARDATIERARGDLARIVQGLEEAAPDDQARNVAIERFVETNIGERSQAALRAMVIASLGLLLLAVANLANIRLGHTIERQRELDTRLALGSGAHGLARMLLVENLALGALGTMFAVGVAWALCETLGPALLAGGGLARIYWIEAGIDLRLMALIVGVGMSSSVLGALVPIASVFWRARQHDSESATPTQTLRVRSRGSRWTRGLVITQVGLCFALLLGAGLFAAAARSLLDTEPGFDAEHLASVQLSAYQAELDDDERNAMFEQLLRELDARPEVTATSLASSSPWGYVPRRAVGLDRELLASRTEGLLSVLTDEGPRPAVMSIGAGFLETLELPLLAGRDFDQSDFDGDTASAIISRALAERLFDTSRDAIGKNLILAGRPSASDLRVVGVTADLRLDRSDGQHRDLHLFVPEREADAYVLLVRKRSDQMTALSLVEDALRVVNPRVGTLEELDVETALASSLWVERRLSQILSLFGAAALLLSAAGTYAVISLMVRTREHEMGVRAAVGAAPRDLVRLVLGQGAAQVVAGLVVGCLAILAGFRLVDHVLVEGLTWQPGVALGAAALVTLSSLAACWGPTRRAARTDPTLCLRRD